MKYPGIRGGLCRTDRLTSALMSHSGQSKGERPTKDANEEAQDVDAGRALHARHEADADSPGALEGRKPDARRDAAVGEDELGRDEEERVANAVRAVHDIELVAEEVELQERSRAASA
jgi:hypothetical protein